MHGGMGLNGLSLAELEQNHLPASLQKDYEKSLKEISKVPVDIVIPSHISHYPGNYMEMVRENDGSGQSMRIPGAWQQMMQDRISQIENLIEKDQKMMSDLNTDI